MSYRTDTFSVGDQVTWFDDSYASITDGRSKMGNGPFTILQVIDRPYEPPSSLYEDDQSNWESMGHTQHVEVDGHSFSGAFFKRID